MPFVYRLQKILDFRIRKKEEQLLVVQKAQQEVFIAEQKIRDNEAEIQQTVENRKTARRYDRCVEKRGDNAFIISALNYYR